VSERKGEFRLEDYREFQRHLESKGFETPAGFARTIYKSGLWDDAVAAYRQRRGKCGILKWYSRFSYAECLAYACYRKAIEGITGRAIVSAKDYAFKMHATGLRDADIKRFKNGLPSVFLRRRRPRGRVGMKKSRFTFEQCLMYARHLEIAGQLGDASARQFARAIHQSGRHDEAIEAWWVRYHTRRIVAEIMHDALDEAADNARGGCAICGGAGFYYPEGEPYSLVLCAHGETANVTIKLRPVKRKDASAQSAPTPELKRKTTPARPRLPRRIADLLPLARSIIEYAASYGVPVKTQLEESSYTEPERRRLRKALKLARQEY
jgi:hypothetical protein